MSEQTPSFYAILPSSIRYDKDLSSSEKIFYAEITSMSNVEGYCWATNKYFATLYGKSTTTISTWVNNLKRLGHFKVEMITKGKEVVGRKIYPLVKKDTGVSEKFKGGYPKNANDNTTRDNTTSINKKKASLFPQQEDTISSFSKSLLADEKVFKNKFSKEEQNGIDIMYYYNAVSDWCDSLPVKDRRAKKNSKGWAATIRNFMRSDKEKNKLQMLIKSNGEEKEDVLNYLKL